MKQINFSYPAKNYYHLVQEKPTETINKTIIGIGIVTGHTKELIEIGDELNIGGTIHTVTKINELRNHAGEFLKTEDKINSFFKVETTFCKRASN